MIDHGLYSIAKDWYEKECLPDYIPLHIRNVFPWGIPFLAKDQKNDSKYRDLSQQEYDELQINQLYKIILDWNSKHGEEYQIKPIY